MTNIWSTDPIYKKKGIEVIKRDTIWGFFFISILQFKSTYSKFEGLQIDVMYIHIVLNDVLKELSDLILL